MSGRRFPTRVMFPSPDSSYCRDVNGMIHGAGGYGGCGKASDTWWFCGRSAQCSDGLSAPGVTHCHLFAIQQLATAAGRHLSSDVAPTVNGKTSGSGSCSSMCCERLVQGVASHLSDRVQLGSVTCSHEVPFSIESLDLAASCLQRVSGSYVVSRRVPCVMSVCGCQQAAVRRQPSTTTADDDDRRRRKKHRRKPLSTTAACVLESLCATRREASSEDSSVHTQQQQRCTRSAVSKQLIVDSSISSVVPCNHSNSSSSHTESGRDRQMLARDDVDQPVPSASNQCSVQQQQLTETGHRRSTDDTDESEGVSPEAVTAGACRSPSTARRLQQQERVGAPAESDEPPQCSDTVRQQATKTSTCRSTDDTAAGENERLSRLETVGGGPVSTVQRPQHKQVDRHQRLMRLRRGAVVKRKRADRRRRHSSRTTLSCRLRSHSISLATSPQQRPHVVAAEMRRPLRQRRAGGVSTACKSPRADSACSSAVVSCRRGVDDRSKSSQSDVLTHTDAHGRQTTPRKQRQQQRGLLRHPAVITETEVQSVAAADSVPLSPAFVGASLRDSCAVASVSAALSVDVNCDGCDNVCNSPTSPLPVSVASRTDQCNSLLKHAAWLLCQKRSAFSHVS